MSERDLVLPRPDQGVVSTLAAALVTGLSGVVGTAVVLVEAAAVLPRAVVALERLAASADSLDRLAGLGRSLERIAGSAASLDRLAEASQALQALGALEPHVRRVAEAEATALVPSALASLTGLPAAVETLQAVVLEMQASLGNVSPDLHAVADVIDRLENSVGVLAGAVAPLQGTSERLGRLVDRIPERFRAAGPTSGPSAQTLPVGRPTRLP